MKKTANLRTIRESGEVELKAKVGELEEQLFGHRMKRFTNQLENTMHIRQTRREIARIKTIIAARKLGVEAKADATAPASTPET